MSFSNIEKIVVITPARNEEKYLPQIYESIINQTLRPLRWVIVSDGSRDETDNYALRYSESHDFTKYVRISDLAIEHGIRIPRAFNAGLQALDVEWNYLCKIDVDFILSKDYFEKIIMAFKMDPSVGIAAGDANDPSLGVSGGNRVYKKECWYDITDGNMPMVDAEDTYLTWKAMSKGWKVVIVESAKSIHLRPESGWSLCKILYQRFKEGMLAYRFGYHPLFFLLMSLRDCILVRKPRFLSFFVVIVGYLYAILGGKRPEIYPARFEKELIRYIRGVQKESLRNIRFRRTSKALRKILQV